MTFYELQAPTEWATPPSKWSTTTVDDVDACPRRWQFLHSRWGEHGRFPVRPSVAAIEGQIVHEALDRLTRACGQRGNPAFGTVEFGAAATDADFFPGFARAVAEWQQRLDAHPRPGPVFRMRTTPEELANRAVRMFRSQYLADGRAMVAVAERVTGGTTDMKALLRRKSALAELKLQHPDLPFGGVLDRVQQTTDGAHIVDFKTGKPSEKHHAQLLRYALLWWRVTGDLPARISAQYLDGAESWPVSQVELSAVEASLAKKLPSLRDLLLTRPAAARPGAGCLACPVRARCRDGWSVGEEAASVDGRGDAELVVGAKAGEHGFVARSRTGGAVSVVYEVAVSKLLPEHAEGGIIRVLDGVWKEKRSQLEIKAWTEIFVVAAEERS